MEQLEREKAEVIGLGRETDVTSQSVQPPEKHGNERVRKCSVLSATSTNAC